MLGVLSLILWSLIIVVTAKYVLVLLRADNNGEGGTLSLTALASRALGRRTAYVFIVGVIGASMFLGDSRDHAGDLGALGGRRPEARHAPPSANTWRRSTVVILIALFAAQSRGTAKVAAMFGPIMVVWFVAIAVAGVHAYPRRSARARRHQSATTASTSCSPTARSAWSRSARYSWR